MNKEPTMKVAANDYQAIIEAEMRAMRKAEEREEYKGYTVAALRRAMEAVQDPKDWKAPWAAAVPCGAVGAVCAAVEFFHADRAVVVGAEPLTGKVLMRGQGYQA
jgi:hypothetical protein